MGSVGTQYVWLKRDLRLSDHPALEAALNGGHVQLVYIIEPEVVGAPDFDALHWGFIGESLADLQIQVEAKGGFLIIERGEAVEVLKKLHQAAPMAHLWAHEETGNAITYARDLRVAEWAKSEAIPFTELPQNGVVRRLASRDTWARRWEKRMSAPIIPATDRLSPLSAKLQSSYPKPCELPTAEALGLEPSDKEPDLVGGETAGWTVLHSFIKDRGHRYQKEMSSPLTAFESCSRLSAYLAWGCLSMRSIVQTVREAAEAGEMPKVATRAFLSRCHWHCHFMQKLESEPEIEFRAFNPICDNLRERGAHVDRLEALKNGTTGYPYVDACIRALKTRGWINFRMRAMLVSFSSYHLWLDWRDFEDWLACQFIDYEPGIHFSQIQMQSGLTGINTLRIYNPIKQGYDHDPEGVFVREWVSELRKIPDSTIHEPWKLPDKLQSDYAVQLGRDYPLPIVDHLPAVREARRKFAELRKRDDFWEASKEVLEKHGSRKGGQRRPQRAKKKATASTQSELSLSDAKSG